MSTIQSKANQAIAEVALRIMESWDEWEAEAGQIAQCEQNPAPYEDFMMHQLTTVIRICVHNVQRITDV